jgi:hypothetical protein
MVKRIIDRVAIRGVLFDLEGKTLKVSFYDTPSKQNVSHDLVDASDYISNLTIQAIDWDLDAIDDLIALLNKTKERLEERRANTRSDQSMSGEYRRATLIESLRSVREKMAESKKRPRMWSEEELRNLIDEVLRSPKLRWVPC